MKGKRKRPIPATLPLVTQIDGKDRTVFVETNDYPIVFNMLIYGAPGVLRGAATRGPTVVGMTAAILKYDRKVLFSKYRVHSFASPVWDTVMLCRMLAKIGFALAVAELGRNGFASRLPELILDDNREVICFIGGDPDAKMQRSEALHELAIGYQRFKRKTYVVVTVRLFAANGRPTYKVVVGESLESASARIKRVLSSKVALMLAR